MKFHTLLFKYENNIILERLNELYPRISSKRLVSRLKGSTPYKTSALLSVRYIYDEMLQRELIDIYGLLPFDNTLYSLDETPYDEFLDMHINPRSLEQFTDIDIICHVLNLIAQRNLKLVV